MAWALQERFVEIQNKFPKPGDRQPFFKQPLEDVLPAFEDLAKSLHNTCSQEEDFFRVSVIDMLNQLTEQKKEKEVKEILNDFVSFLNSKRVLYQSINIEN